MATTIPPLITRTPAEDGIPPLRTGDRLTWPEFERRYEAMPDVRKAELIEGVVYVPSPVSEEHSGPHFYLMGWLTHYSAATPGVVGGDNGTIRLASPEHATFIARLQDAAAQATRGEGPRRDPS